MTSKIFRPSRLSPSRKPKFKSRSDTRFPSRFTLSRYCFASKTVFIFFDFTKRHGESVLSSSGRRLFFILFKILKNSIFPTFELQVVPYTVQKTENAFLSFSHRHSKCSPSSQRTRSLKMMLSHHLDHQYHHQDRSQDPQDERVVLFSTRLRVPDVPIPRDRNPPCP